MSNNRFGDACGAWQEMQSSAAGGCPVSAAAASRIDS
jgi:hypothetical protein